MRASNKLLQSRLLAGPGIEVLRNTIVTEIKGSERTVHSVSLMNTETGDLRQKFANQIVVAAADGAIAALAAAHYVEARKAILT